MADGRDIRVNHAGAGWIAFHVPSVKNDPEGSGETPEEALADLLAAEFRHVTEAFGDIYERANATYETCKGGDCGNCPMIGDDDEPCELEKLLEILKAHQGGT